MEFGYVVVGHEGVLVGRRRLILPRRVQSFGFDIGWQPPAMVLRLRGYGAWIESDGKPLEEYAVEVEGNTISCYVCSEDGKVRIEPPPA